MPMEDIAQQDDGDVFPGKAQRFRPGAEQGQGAVAQQQPQDGDGQGGAHQQDEGVAQDLLGLVTVALPQADGYQRGRAHAHQHAEGHGDDHDGEGHGQTGEGQRPDPAADVDPVDKIVESIGQHADDGGDEVFPE